MEDNKSERIIKEAFVGGRKIVEIVEAEENSKIVNILGTEYCIKTDDDIAFKNCDGICREYDKEILIRSLDMMLPSVYNIEAKERRKKEVLRHELIHAFFSESGLDDYSDNEQLVNWIAIQFPKMVQVFKEADCL